MGHPTLSLHQYPHYIVSAWSLVDRVYCTIWIVCRLQICCDFNSKAQDTSWKQTRNQKTHNHPKEPSKNMCSCFQLLKLPHFIQTKTNLRPTWCGKKSRPWKIRIWIPWIVPPCCPIVPCALALGDIEPFVVRTSRRLWRWENTDRYILICLLNEYDMMLISWIMNSTGKNLGTLEIASTVFYTRMYQLQKCMHLLLSNSMSFLSETSARIRSQRYQYHSHKTYKTSLEKPFFQCH